MPGRTTVIVTRQKDYVVEGATVVHSLEAALAASSHDSEVFVIGGGELYQLALPLAQRIYLTTVDAEPAGDTRMPDFNNGTWREISNESFTADEKHAHAYRFSVMERNQH